jgi:hypothetical protein
MKAVTLMVEDVKITSPTPHKEGHGHEQERVIEED